MIIIYDYYAEAAQSIKFAIINTQLNALYKKSCERQEKTR